MTDEEIEAIMTTAERRHPGNEEILSAIKGLLGKHVDESHIGLEQEQIETLVNEHRELYDEVAPLARDTNEKVTLLVDDMYGEPHPTAADPSLREGGWVTTLRSMQHDVHTMQQQSMDGGIKIRRTWSSGQWAFYGSIGGSFIIAMGAVVVSLLG